MLGGVVNWTTDPPGAGLGLVSIVYVSAGQEPVVRKSEIVIMLLDANI